MKKILYALILPLIFACNKDNNDNNSEDLPNEITSGNWIIVNQIDSLGEQTEQFLNSCQLTSYYTFNSNGMRDVFEYGIDSNNDCVVNGIFSHPYEEISDNYFRIYYPEILESDNITFVQDVYILNDTMSVSYNSEISDYDFGTTTILVRQKKATR